MSTNSPPTESHEPPESSSLRATLKRFPAPVWVIFLGAFINRFGTFVMPFLALHLTRLGYSLKEAGVAIAAYGAGHLAASIVGGHLADTLGRRKTIILSMTSGALSLLLLMQAREFGWILVLAALSGLTVEFYKPSSSALLTDLTSLQDRVIAFAVYRFALNLGWAFGPATAGLLAAYSYDWLFIGDAATCIAFAILACLALPPDEVRSDKAWHDLRSAVSGMGEAVVYAWKDKAYLRFLMALLAVAFVFIQMFSTFGMEVTSSGYSERDYGLILGLNGVIIILCEIPLSAWTRRFPPRPVMATGFLILGGGFAILAVADTFAAYLLAISVFTVGEMISLPVAMAYVSMLAPGHLRGRYLGVYGLTWGIALTVGPAIGLAAFAANPFSYWLGCGVLGIIAAGLLLFPARRRPQPEACLPPGPIATVEEV